MSHFTEAELAYLRESRLARMATVDAKGRPHLTAVGFFYNADLDVIDIGGGYGFFKGSKKFRDAKATGQIALIVDDVDMGASGKEWHPRGIEVRGTAETFESGGDTLRPGYDPQFIRIHPTRIVSWGLDQSGYKPNSRSVPAKE